MPPKQHARRAPPRRNGSPISAKRAKKQAAARRPAAHSTVSARASRQRKQLELLPEFVPAVRVFRGGHEVDVGEQRGVDHFRDLYFAERDKKDAANEAHLRIVITWPAHDTAKGRPACRTFPDCPHPGCLAALDAMRVSARALLDSDTPLTSFEDDLCRAIATKTLSRKHRVIAESLARELGAKS